MRLSRFSLACALFACALMPCTASATDVDGPNDCLRDLNDLGDAPEELPAYAGVPGRFPTCLAFSAPGTYDVVAACPPRSTVPGPTGHVIHAQFGNGNYWLGCGLPGVPPFGIDSEFDGKVSGGAAASFCTPNVTVDCFEPVGPLSFGQDECYGDTDAGVDAPIVFTPCGGNTVTFQTFNCGPPREVYLNILVDMNQDGDWNDNFICAAPTCAYEWAVKNVLITLPNGCATQSASFLVGPQNGPGWMRISISDDRVTDDYPWAGSAAMPGGRLAGGETEDYPVKIGHPEPCLEGYLDLGDAPEEIAAYANGLSAHFPTCRFPGTPGDQTIDCGVPQSTPPGPTGYVAHRHPANQPNGFWFGCTAALPPPWFIDSEQDGKVNGIGLGAPSACDPAVSPDCAETLIPGMPFGQDECYGDDDAGLANRLSFGQCTTSDFRFTAYGCGPDQVQAYLNVLVDWSHDADWNDNVECDRIKRCAAEWAVKNHPVVIAPGCQLISTPLFQVGPREGQFWMRMSLSLDPAPPDFPWAGSANVPGGEMRGGETEDYLVLVEPSPVGVGDAVPGDLWLATVTPNPSSGSHTVRFGLPRADEVSLAVYDVAGRQVRSLASGVLEAGAHVVRWDGRDESGAEAGAGIYLVRLETGGRTLSQRAIRVK
jgi:hypothetical protein